MSILQGSTTTSEVLHRRQRCLTLWVCITSRFNASNTSIITDSLQFMSASNQIIMQVCDVTVVRKLCIVESVLVKSQIGRLDQDLRPDDQAGAVIVSQGSGTIVGSGICACMI